MRVSDFVLNNDGIHCAIAMPGRDQLGRYLGEEAGDDELVEYVAGGSYDPTDDIIARLDGEVSDEDDDTYASCADEDRCGLPEEDEPDYWPVMFDGDAEEHISDEIETGGSLSAYVDYDSDYEGEGGQRLLAMKYSHDDDEPLMPQQCGSTLLRESSAEVLYRPVGYDMTWLSLSDLRTMRGRSHHYDKRLWWKQLADVRRQYKTYDVLTTNTFTFFNIWEMSMLEEIENGKAVIDVFRNYHYYERLLVANSITMELRARWLYEYGEYEYETDDRHHDDFYCFNDEVDPNDQAYYAGEFDRKPVWDCMWGEYLHPEPASHQGWRGYEGEVQTDALAQLHLGDMDFHDAMNDDYARGLGMFQPRRDDDEEEAETLSQHGGPRGWKAAAVFTERLMEATI